MTPEEEALCRELMQADLDRAKEPTEFDRRGCLAVLALLACFWIAALGGVWAWACPVFGGGE